MILHISKDEKFIDTAIDIFEKANPGNNKYIVWQPSETSCLPSFLNRFRVAENNLIYSFPKIKGDKSLKTKYVKSEKPFVFFATYGSNDFFSKIGDISQYQAVIFHSLVYNNAKILKTIRKKTDKPIVWMPFGYEVHNMLPEFNNNLYQSKTTELIKRKKYKQNSGWALLEKYKAKTIKKAILSADICAIAIPEEYQFYRTRLNFKAKFGWFSYYPLEQIASQGKQLPLKNNILVGNSSTPTNNHLEVFEKLRNVDLEGWQIIAPLNYGNMQYATDIKTTGQKYFGEKFQSIDKFLPISEFNSILCTCKIAIMNHNRQQAFGTILALIWQGSKVFLNENNTIYQYLKRIGAYVFSFEEDFNADMLAGLTPVQVEENKKIIFEEYCQNSIYQRTEDMIKRILGSN